ncbi:VWA-like domain-containing protein [uncultured Desulfobacter sp.]|uniref:vWA domain-containing protein n=1 Tax=uncultured Desulfobacter sp. TaxID=240139 RepID=UPI002AABCCDA|nr:VWA-like domain-containing protein [uncultured Desulfobacter sp.]
MAETNPEAKSRLLKARADMVISHPFFACLAMRLTLKEDRNCRTAWTDGRIFGYNPDYINILPREKLIGLSAHTVMHPACGHHMRRGSRDPDLWNQACDYVINPILLDAGLVLPDGFLWDDGYAGKTAEYVYRILKAGGADDLSETDDNPDARPNEAPRDQSRDQDKKEASNVNADNGAAADEAEEDPHQDPDPGGSGEVRDRGGSNEKSFAGVDDEQDDWERALIQAAANARAMGKLPRGVEILIQEKFSPILPWQAILARFIQQSARQDYTWARPNPRYIHQGLYFPALVSDQMPEMVLAVDTSGSVQPGELARFTEELSDIFSLNPSRVHLLYADLTVNRYECIEGSRMDPDLLPKGGGGTDFRAVFEFVRTNGIAPFCLIYFTDMQCTLFPARSPAYPVLWIRAGQGGMDPPFGEVIDMLPENRHDSV